MNCMDYICGCLNEQLNLLIGNIIFHKVIKTFIFNPTNFSKMNL